MKRVEVVFNSLLDLIFPLSRTTLMLEKMSPDEFGLTAKRASNFGTLNLGSRVIVPLQYRDIMVSGAVKAVKYKGNKRVASLVTALIYDELLEEISDMNTFNRNDKFLLVPMPLYSKRRRERGFNQAELLCKELCAHDNSSILVLENNVLIRTKDTPSQIFLRNRKKRMQNVAGCFTVRNREKVAGKSVILLDDVITTGATMREAIRTLREAGVKNIIAVAIAH